MTGANLALPEFGNGLSASIKALNARGGINGHPLQLTQCDSKGDGSTEVQCANQMVSEHVVATLEDTTISNPAQVQTILATAGIPRIGVSELAIPEYMATNNFDFTGGLIFSLMGIVEDLIKKGDTKISVVLPDGPTSGQIHQLVDPIVKNMGAQVVNYVLVNSATGDYSQYVAQAQQNGATGMALTLGNAQLVQMAQSINQLNPKIDWATGISAFSLNQLKQLGGFATKSLWISWEPTIDDTANFTGMKQVQADMAAYEKGFTVNSSTSMSVQSWLAVHAFYEVMKAQTGTPTAASVMAAFQAAKNVPMAGLIKPWSPGVPADAAGLNVFVKNISNPWIYKVTYNGTHASTSPSQMFNTFAGLPAVFTP